MVARPKLKRTDGSRKEWSLRLNFIQHGKLTRSRHRIYQRRGFLVEFMYGILGSN